VKGLDLDAYVEKAALDDLEHVSGTGPALF
jgi:hypothetical protein